MKNSFPLDRSRSMPYTRAALKRQSGYLFILLLFTLHAAAQTTLILNNGSSSTAVVGSGKDAATANGIAFNAGLGAPRALAYDSHDNLFIADSRNNQVTRLSPDGQLIVVAGTGREGYAGDGGPAALALLNRPSSLVIQADGTLVVADTGNHCIRSIAPDGTIRTIAGTGVPGDAGDGSPATNARMRSPSGIALDADGTLLIADTGNHRIRRITLSGTIVAVAGNGKEGDAGDGGPASNATFVHPAALLPLPDKRILIADAGARRVRQLMPDGTIASFTTAQLRHPGSLALDASGSLVVADSELQQLLQIANGGYAVLAGNGKQGSAVTGSLNLPSSATPDASGGIAFADTGNHQVQHIALPSLDFGSVPAGKQSTSQALLLQNGASEPLQITSITLAAAFPLAAGGTCSAFPFTLAPHAACSLQIAFAPQAQGPAKAIGVLQTASGPPSTLLLTGIGSAGTNLAVSNTALTSTGSISYSGAPIQFTANVTGSLLAAPTGTIAFQDGTNTIATASVTSGKAILATSALTIGQHTLRAVYSGDALYSTSTSATITQTVVAAPDFSVSTAAGSYGGSASGTVTIPITVLPLNGTLNHAANVTINGLPTGATATFLPSTFNLTGDPVAITLLIKLPATLAYGAASKAPWIAATLLLAMLPWKRRHASTLLLAIGMLFLQGCGGFRTTTTPTSGGSTTHRYTCAITVTTTGVLGDTLTHSIPLELDLTQ